MNFSLDVKAVGITETAAAAGRAKATFESGLRPAMDDSVALVRSALETRTPTGPGHFGGHTRSSFRVTVTGNATSITGHVFTTMPQGRWLQGGTRAHQIAPRRKRALKLGGRFASRVGHPGQAARDIKGQAATASYPLINRRFSELAQLTLRMLKVY